MLYLLSNNPQSQQTVLDCCVLVGGADMAATENGNKQTLLIGYIPLCWMQNYKHCPQKHERRSQITDHNLLK